MKIRTRPQRSFQGLGRLDRAGLGSYARDQKARWPHGPIMGRWRGEQREREKKEEAHGKEKEKREKRKKKKRKAEKERENKIEKNRN